LPLSLQPCFVPNPEKFTLRQFVEQFYFLEVGRIDFPVFAGERFDIETGFEIISYRMKVRRRIIIRPNDEPRVANATNKDLDAI